MPRRLPRLARPAGRAFRMATLGALLVAPAVAHPAEEITLRQVVEAIEGRSYAISRCIVPDGECSRDRWGCCSFQKVWRDISNEVNAHMDRVNFAQLVRDDEALRQGKQQAE